ncbi:Pimeloyl-ACP methyl ester carboxylesterase [Kaistia soli DSM 19436]|uniref:Pimeloyl-ACP methyl ester carboxylesterase n=1 Tax=Kaistia soli DSM 19436 TaxID=1122133 RepID=A0A1M5I9W7_9HYPH|nr:alpha/beta hydrolase [Kaistia soli]SHG25051.1 Pimeloyl-ACP methyl ester carboxylesterase [Kaistia soli DSM 19436]
MQIVMTTLLLAAATLGATAAVAQEKAKNVVLVHGAFADETSWDKVAAILKAKGFSVTQVKNPLTSLADDVTATKAALDAQSGPTVLVAHSWGGVVIGEAGSDQKVKALVYVSAFAPDKGESLNKLLEGAPPSEGTKAIRPNAEGGLIFDPAAFPTLFAGDLPKAEAEAMAATQIPSNPANFGAVAEVAAWHDKPTFYVVTTKDMVIPPDAQRFFAGRMKASVTEIPASHAGLVSEADAVAAVIDGAAQ